MAGVGRNAVTVLICGVPVVAGVGRNPPIDSEVMEWAPAAEYWHMY